MLLKLITIIFNKYNNILLFDDKNLLLIISKY